MKNFSVEDYFKRIGFQEQIRQDKRILDQLMLAHQCHIPYENLDVYYNCGGISLEKKDLFEKLILRERGGYCFELNGSFYYLLKELGFTVYPCFCRVQKGAEEIQPIRHQGNIVILEGDCFFADVGYGSALCPASLRLQSGLRQNIRDDVYWFEEYNNSWYYLMHKTSDLAEDSGAVILGGIKCELLVGRFFVEPFDFEIYNEFTSKSEESPFKRHRRIHRLTEDGSIALMDKEITIIKNRQKTSKKIQTEEEFREVLKEYFSINFTCEVNR